MMVDLIVRIAGMIVSLAGTIVKAIELIKDYRNQKSNRSPRQS